MIWSKDILYIANPECCVTHIDHELFMDDESCLFYVLRYKLILFGKESSEFIIIIKLRFRFSFNPFHPF